VKACLKHVIQVQGNYSRKNTQTLPPHFSAVRGAGGPEACWHG